MQHIRFIMSSLLEQIKKHRIALKLKQHDMILRVGISHQQYQWLESKDNPRLDTLELVAKRLKSELLLLPEEKLNFRQKKRPTFRLVLFFRCVAEDRSELITFLPL